MSRTESTTAVLLVALFAGCGGDGALTDDPGDTSTSTTTSTTTVTDTPTATDSVDTPNEGPVLYLSFLSHNEEPNLAKNRPDWTADEAFYKENRALLREFVKTITKAGAAFTFQSDWNYLMATQMFETADVTTDTDGLSILHWMKAAGVQIDPHAHESSHNYADVAYLLTANGLEPTKVVGGFLYDPPNNFQGWEKHIDGLNGDQYPSYFWQADILWGAATLNHQGNDETSSGIWRPKDRYNFTEHDDAQRLLYVASCDSRFSGVKKLLADFDADAAPADGFYTASIMYPQDFMTSQTIEEIAGIIAQLQPRVDAGQVVWATINEQVAAWENAGSVPSRHPCEE